MRPRLSSTRSRAWVRHRERQELSAAIPPAFAPVKFEGLYLVDGAISSNTPVKVAVALGAQRLIILPTGYACALELSPTGAVANALHALTLLIARQLLSELEVLDQQINAPRWLGRLTRPAKRQNAAVPYLIIVKAAAGWGG